MLKHSTKQGAFTVLCKEYTRKEIGENEKMRNAFGGILFVVLLFLLTACRVPFGAEQASGLEDELPENFVAFQGKDWSQNEYTASLPQLEAGTLLEGWIDTDKKNCHIQFSDISQTQFEQYIQALENTGFKEVESVSEKTNNDTISTSILLSNENTFISISYVDNLLVMYIKK